MKSIQTKRKPPDLETAHRFHKEGSFSVDPRQHTLRDTERDAEIEKVSESLREITKKFPRTQNLEYALLKSHLIIEYAITEHIRAHAATYVDEADLRMSFSQKLEVAYLMGFGVHHPTVLPTIKGLNRLRNQIAHTFELDRSRLDEILRLNSEDYDNHTVESDRQRIRELKYICIFLCALVSGEMQAAYAMEK